MLDDQRTITATDLLHVIGGRTVFRDLDLSTCVGAVHAVIGPSGVGKSTLLRMIGGLELPTAGTIRAFGSEVTALRPAALRRYLRHTVGFVFQDAGLVEHWSVRKNVEVAAAAAPRRSAGATLSVEAAMDAVDLPRSLLDRRATELSGGERQRVAMARVLVRKPQLVLMDEPTASLDADRTALVGGLVRGFAHDGAAVLIATHDDHLVRMSDSRTLISEHSQSSELSQSEPGQCSDVSQISEISATSG